MDFLQIANLVVTAALAVIGLYLAHSYRRQVALRVAELRLTAYAALWGKMSVATPVRIAPWNKLQPLTAKEREELFRLFSDWYYENGNGMLLGNSTRTIYLCVKDNLVRPIEHYEPKSIRYRLRKLPPESQEQERGRLAIRQLSLLRTRMKADLSVYGVPYHSGLDEDDKALLRHCGEKLNKRPWVRRRSTLQRASHGEPNLPLEAANQRMETEAKV